MDASDSTEKAFLLNASNTNRKRKAEEHLDCSIVPSKRFRFYATYNRYQTFSLPDSLIYYITKNPPTPKYYQKIIQSCKYFFIKNPILIFSNVYYRNNEWRTWVNEKSKKFRNISSKIWITNLFTANNNTDNTNEQISSVVCKIYQSDVKAIHLHHLTISLKHLKLLASKCQQIYFLYVSVIDENLSCVGLENILEALPHVKEFYFRGRDKTTKFITSKTVAQLLKIPHFSNLNNFHLAHIPEEFDINCFYEYIKKNEKTKICLYFCDQISEAYQNRLQIIVTEIIAAENRNYKPPFIQFPGNDETSREKLFQLYSKN